MAGSKFKGIKVDRVFEKIIQQIRSLIEEEVLKPGDKLPSERELSEDFGCSRASVREALRVLELEGVLITKHGEGRFVQHVDQGLIMEYRVNPLDLIEKSAIIHFLEAREKIEPQIAEVAAERANSTNIEKMENIIETLREQFNQPDEEIGKDNTFIIAMAEATQNFIFISIVESYLNMLRKVKKKSSTSSNSQERFEASLEEQKAILTAIKKRDPKAAADAVLVHIHNMKKHLLND